MSSATSAGGGTEPGVWDADGGAAVTSALCRAVAAAWKRARRRGESAGVLAPWPRFASTPREPPRNLLKMHGYDLGDQLDPVLGATVTGMHLGREAVAGPGSDRRWGAIAYAALDAVAARDDRVAVADVAAVYAAVDEVAPALQAVFEHRPTADPSHAWVTVGALTTGVGVGLLTGPAELGRLERMVALVASCSAATGPAAFGGEAEAFLLGRAAGNAVLASRLADTGFSVNPRTLEAPRGLLRAMTGSIPGPDAIAGLDAIAVVSEPSVHPAAPADQRPWPSARAAVANEEVAR